MSVSGQVRRIAVAALAAALLAPSAIAEARERHVPSTGPLPEGAVLGHAELKDTVLPARSLPVLRAAGVRAASRAYSTADGRRVHVAVSSAYSADPTADQALVDFLGSRLHGPELGGLAVYVGAPREITRLCGGPGAVACYAPDEQRMYVPGEAVHGIPVEYALTHEYGHHLAAWRRNSPWNALSWGAKHWSSAVHVCRHVDAGRLHPGNQGRHYLEDPGEGFADGYAHLHYPRASWQYSGLMRPGRRAYAALRRDVLEPWTGPRSRTLRGRLGGGRRTMHLRLALDGDVKVRLSMPRGARATVEVRAAGYAAARTVSGGGAFGIEWCRRRAVERVTVAVHRRAGGGPFTLKVRWPG